MREDGVVRQVLVTPDVEEFMELQGCGIDETHDESNALGEALKLTTRRKQGGRRLKSCPPESRLCCSEAVMYEVLRNSY